MFDEDNRSPDRSHEWPRRFVVTRPADPERGERVVPLAPAEGREQWLEEHQEQAYGT